MSDFAVQRRFMVDNQLRTYDVTDRDILAAMAEVPRERFVADPVLAYLDRTVPMLAGQGRQMLTPMVFARLVQAAGVTPGAKVLDVGCGTGYGAAVLTTLGADVTALESDPALADAAAQRLSGLNLVRGALAQGWKAAAPYDVVVIEGSFEVEPSALLEQLADGGRLVGIKGTGRAAKAVIYTRSGGAAGSRTITEAAGPLLPGFEASKSFVF